MKVTLRSLRPTDVDALFDAVRESEAEITPWLPWCHAGYTREEAMDWIGQKIQAFEAGTEHPHAVLGEGGEFLGVVTINRRDDLHRRANVGYWIRTAFAGQGLGTESVRQLIDWAFANTNLRRLEIVVGVGNEGSIRLAKKLGAVDEGVLRDRLCVAEMSQDAHQFAVLRSEWVD